MPIRPDLRKFYSRAAGWPEVRARILARAGGRFDERGKYLGGAKCERCGKPDRKWVLSACGGFWALQRRLHLSQCPRGGWRTRTGTRKYSRMNARRTFVVLTVAHLNHNPRDNCDGNLRALCQSCHLNHDRLHHKDTRAARKDSNRPLLAAAREEEDSP